MTNCLGAAASAASSTQPARVVEFGEADAKASAWLETSLHRVFSNTHPGTPQLNLLAARNSRISFQACVRSEKIAALFTACTIAGADDLKPRVRWVGSVPVAKFSGSPWTDMEGLGSIPGYVPDPLTPLTKVNFGPFQSHSYWITLNIPAGAKPGQHALTVKLSLREKKDGEERVVEMPVQLEISPLVVQPRKDFPVTHWWRGEATWDYYKTGMFEDERWWQITREQLKNMLEHGSDVVYVPMFFNRRETFKRPCQLLLVSQKSTDAYEFDFARVKRFTDMCREIGFKRFEWPHLWIYWGVKNPMRIYAEKAPGQYEMLWPPDISGFSDTYMAFLRQFLPQFHGFLVKEDLLEGSYFHLSDEPSAAHIENYRKARQILHELAPWMKTMDALSDIRYGKEGVTDIPIPVVSAAQAYIDAKLPHWVYYCCNPTGVWLNRFEDTPLTKIRMSGWIFYRLQAKGFLHWGFNYWHKLEKEELVDPFLDTTAGGIVPAGDPFMIYPGADGHPIDSIRWEVFAESLQDYAILQSAGIKPGDSLLDEIKSYKDFPRSEDWISQATRKVLQSAASPSAEQ